MKTPTLKLKSYISLLSYPPLPVLLIISAIAWLLLWFGGHQHAHHSEQAHSKQDHLKPHQAQEQSLAKFTEQNAHKHHDHNHSPTHLSEKAIHAKSGNMETAHFSPGEIMTIGQLSGWILMVLAMMFPLLHNALRHIWHRSLPRLRVAGCTLFCLSYLALWTVVGYLLHLLLQISQHIAAWKVALCGMIILLLWQASPTKQWALNYCHYTQRLALSGWHYYRGSLSFGLKKGYWCIISCWHLMIFPMLFESFILMFVLMLTVCIWMFIEQHMPPRSPHWSMPFRFKEIIFNG